MCVYIFLGLRVVRGEGLALGANEELHRLHRVAPKLLPPHLLHAEYYDIVGNIIQNDIFIQYIYIYRSSIVSAASRRNCSRPTCSTQHIVTLWIHTSIHCIFTSIIIIIIIIITATPMSEMHSSALPRSRRSAALAPGRDAPSSPCRPAARRSGILKDY